METVDNGTWPLQISEHVSVRSRERTCPRSSQSSIAIAGTTVWHYTAPVPSPTSAGPAGCECCTERFYWLVELVPSPPVPSTCKGRGGGREERGRLLLQPAHSVSTGPGSEPQYIYSDVLSLKICLFLCSVLVLGLILYYLKSWTKKSLKHILMVLSFWGYEFLPPPIKWLYVRALLVISLAILPWEKQKLIAKLIETEWCVSMITSVWYQNLFGTALQNPRYSLYNDLKQKMTNVSWGWLFIVSPSFEWF